ncbi:MAG: 1,4-beta-glucanase [Ruminococcus sp.]|nr:1,4-beta-glucanase [Ruminococcus sp.]
MTLKKAMAGLFAVCLTVTASVPYALTNNRITVADAVTENVADTMKWDTLKIGGAGFVSGIVTGQKEMYLRTDVGGAYKWNYETSEWEQLMAFINDADRGLLSVKGMAIDPTDDNTVYFLCGCAYFSDARTVIFKTTDGGKTFTQSDVTEHIQVHGNGDGRECIEPIAIDPDNPDIIYAGGDVTAGKSALIKSTDGGETWNPVMGYDELGLFTESLKYPAWTDHMVRGTEAKEYNAQNGIGCILIEDGKVYVGTSVTGQTNIHVADVETDEFEELSSDLPNENYPCSITSDKHGNIFFTYIAGLAFGGSAGGAYKYEKETGKVTQFTDLKNAIGMIEADPDDPNKLLARTCGVFSDQWFEKEWTDGSIAWGDHFFRSTDAGETWQDITPGQGDTIYDADGSHKVFVSLPIDTNGYDWIYGKACHWGSAILLDPRNPDRILMTSGNGVYACDNVWDETGVQFYFQPDGVEEVVVLDFVSIPGGYPYSAIGDYDGFKHLDEDIIGLQHKPNMGSTSAIAYCPQNPDVMIRIAENENNTGSGFYSLDGGETWTKMKNPIGGKGAITQIGDGEYRFFAGSKDSGDVSYSDDFGETWNKCTGIPTQYGSKPTYLLVEPENPEIVYAYATYYNSSWGYSKPEPDISDACYKFCVSTDGGKTFTSTDICMYDQCDSAGRIAYLGEGNIILGAGYYGMYNVKLDNGKMVSQEKLDSVSYCKTVGYGAPEKEGDPNTLFMYGKPSESDPDGVYRSQDGGHSWVCINTDHLYGGTGNGNFLVGDMNEFGKVYMSTVGCGIVYGELSDGNTDTKPIVTTATKPKDDDKTTTTTATSVKPSNVLWGDADESGGVNINDAVLIMQSNANPDRYTLTKQGAINADVVDNGDGITNSDALAIQYIESRTISSDAFPITSAELDKLGD